MIKKILFLFLVILASLTASALLVSAYNEFSFIPMHTSQYRNFSTDAILYEASSGYDGLILWNCDDIFNTTLNTEVSREELLQSMIAASDIIRKRGDTPYMGVSCNIHRVGTHVDFTNQTYAFLDELKLYNITPVLEALISTNSTGATMAKYVSDNSSLWVFDEGCQNNVSCIPASSYDPVAYILNESQSRGYKVILRSTFGAPFRDNFPDVNGSGSVMNGTDYGRLDLANTTARQYQIDLFTYMSYYGKEYPSTFIGFGWEEPGSFFSRTNWMLGGYSQPGKDFFFNQTGLNLSVTVNYSDYGGAQSQLVLEHNQRLLENYYEMVYNSSHSISNLSVVHNLNVGSLLYLLQGIRPQTMKIATDSLLTDPYFSNYQTRAVPLAASDLTRNFTGYNFNDNCAFIILRTYNRGSSFYFFENTNYNTLRELTIATALFAGVNGFGQSCIVDINQLSAVVSSYNGTMVLMDMMYTNGEASAILNWTARGNTVVMPMYMEFDENATLDQASGLTSMVSSVNIRSGNLSVNDDRATNSFNDISGNRDWMKQLYVSNYSWTNVSFTFQTSNAIANTKIAVMLNNQSGCVFNYTIPETVLSSTVDWYAPIPAALLTNTCLPKQQRINITYWVLNSSGVRDSSEPLRVRTDTSRNGTTWYDGNNGQNPPGQGSALWTMQNYENMIGLEFLPNELCAQRLLCNIGYLRRNVTAKDMQLGIKNVTAVVDLWDMNAGTNVSTSGGRTYDEWSIFGETDIFQYENASFRPVSAIPYNNGTFVIVKGAYKSGGYGNFHPGMDTDIYDDEANARFVRNLLGYGIKQSMKNTNTRPRVLVNPNSSYVEGALVSYDSRYVFISTDSSNVFPSLNFSSLQSGSDVYSMAEHKVISSDVSNGFTINASSPKLIAVEPLKGYVFSRASDFVVMQNISGDPVDSFVLPYRSNIINNTLGFSATISFENMQPSRLVYPNGTQIVFQSGAAPLNITLNNNQYVSLYDLSVVRLRLSGTGKHLKLSGNNTHLKLSP